ncbi:NAD(P)/FAD-dependent oxidoreductase [Bradyrhizobium sp. SRS-191]|uniref:FAD-dependent oxidoreductase n=1 Tax=Bradyrhizobium sp. SRS-191 TaxID=2962606 RepID=UPI00211F2F73|nr:FAD-dependent monooxygenase [Bradyrhizobium sp. SRS-191]
MPHYTDIAIIGGGLAGSITAAMLGRAGIAAILVDPHAVYPPDFRIEKISGVEQIARFRRTGTADKALRGATLTAENWIARFGYVLDKAPVHQYGIRYDALVAGVREEIPAPILRIVAKATAITPGDDRQSVVLSTGESISARLVVLANGLNVGLRHQLGITRTITSPAHSISVGFDLEPVGRPAFPFPAMTYFQERANARVPYVTLFPIGERMRANLFAYREVDDPCVRAVRRSPAETLDAALPGLKRITGAYAVTGEVKVRPADLIVNSGQRMPGVVLVGDAFCTTCPVTGTGSDKVFTDVERLCNVHIPRWLATDGMSEGKIAAFYDDPVKAACDAWSLDKAWRFRDVSIGSGPYWLAQRWARFAVSLGRGVRHRLASTPLHAYSSSSSSSSSSRSSSSSSSSLSSST